MVHGRIIARVSGKCLGTYQDPGNILKGPVRNLLKENKWHETRLRWAYCTISLRTIEQSRRHIIHEIYEIQRFQLLSLSIYIYIQKLHSSAFPYKISTSMYSGAPPLLPPWRLVKLGPGRAPGEPGRFSVSTRYCWPFTWSTKDRKDRSDPLDIAWFEIDK